MEWTKEQQKVIDSRRRNLLVSAAAGSGKTAVLVERILELVLDPQHPMDIDRLLVVTFTKAAAQEMRERLHKELLNRAEKNPENLHIRRQLQLVFRAEVCTIDSFCTNLVKVYAHELDMDPAFRVGDQTEIDLLMSDTVKNVLEKCYAAGETSFLNFSEAFAAGKDDSRLEDLILRLYKFSESAPWPEEWLQHCVSAYRAETPEEINEAPWCQFLLQQINTLINDDLRDFQDILSDCVFPGPDFLYDYVQESIDMVSRARDFKTVSEAQAALAQISWEKRKPSLKKTFSGDYEFAKQVSDRFDAVRKREKELAKSLPLKEDELLLQVQRIRPLAEELLRLTFLFRSEFAAAKRKKGIVSFSDLEHFSLGILYKDHERSEIAKQLSRRYEEIMIDEYQDSNEVQDTLLRAISREEEGQPNIFMVGDMKQSIYRFRMARPELFMEKYGTYSQEESLYQKIELHANFRSRQGVVDAVNFFFDSIMRDDVGGIEYDDAAKLNFKANYAETELKISGEPEILLLTEEDLPKEGQTPEAETSECAEDLSGAREPENRRGPVGTDESSGRSEDSSPAGDEEDSAELEIAADIETAEWEARMIAAEIRRLMDAKDPLYVFAGEKGYRKIEYRDIVVLLRTTKHRDNVMKEIFENCGIPAYLESKEGYFEAWEVRLVLDLLSCIDNPIQDIPLAATLRSPLFGFTADELGRIKAAYSVKNEGNGFFGAVNSYREEETLCEKIRNFLQKLETWREAAKRENLSALLRRIYTDTDLLAFVTAMPGGAGRAANLQALLVKAEAFEKTSYHGIFHFIRYIDKLRKYAADMGEAGTVGENDNTVRIMSIHKSKGLEFPVVFVAGCGKKFNKQELNSAVILHQDCGIGMDEIDVEKRVRRPSLVKQAMRRKLETEDLGEELRILYVAMTRAKEKLYLVDASYNYDANRGYYAERWKESPEKLSCQERISATSYIEWILRAYRESAPVKLRVLSKTALFSETSTDEVLTERSDSVHEAFSDLTDAKDAWRTVSETLSFDYHYDDLSKAYATLSVSALKAAWLEKREDQDRLAALIHDAPEAEKTLPRPSFMSQEAEKAPGGAERGTLYHAVMERIDPHLRTEEEVLSALEEMEKAGLISALEKDTINPSKVAHFLQSELNARFAAAYDRKCAFRERQFIIGRPVRETLPELHLKKREKEELLMIQGVIDMYFEEEDGLVLVDYKTDAVAKAADLVSKYSIQLDYYQDALEQATRKKVKEKWIYSFTLDEEIRL